MVDKLKFEFNGSFQCRLSTKVAGAIMDPKRKAHVSASGHIDAYGAFSRWQVVIPIAHMSVRLF